MNEAELQFKEYLGDGAYVGYDGYHIWLYTTNGLYVTNEIALEPSVLENLQRWIEALSRQLQKK